MTMEDSFRWVFFNIGIALFPIWATKLICRVFRVELTWTKLLRDGELFVFASTLTASTMNTAFFERNVGDPGIMVSGCALVLILMISSGLFFATVQRKFEAAGAGAAAETVAAHKDPAVGKASVYCAVSAIVLSYFVTAAAERVP